MATAASVEWPAFRVGHATHPDAHMALALAAAQVEAQAQAQTQPWTGTGVATPNLGWLYITDRYVDAASTLLRELRLRWPGVAWTGCVGIGVAASGVEYFDEPALVLMLAALPQGSFRLFNGQHPLPRGLAHTALVHADGAEADLQTLVGELAERTDSGYLFGGLTASRGRNLQFSLPVQVALDPEGEAAGLYEGGVSGVAFDAGLPLLSRVTQGCQPVGPVRQVTAAQNNLVLGLDGEPALPALLADLGVTLDDPKQALPRLRATLAGLTDSRDDMLLRAGQFGADTRVRHLIGLDPLRSGVGAPRSPGTPPGSSCSERRHWRSAVTSPTPGSAQWFPWQRRCSSWSQASRPTRPRHRCTERLLHDRCSGSGGSRTRGTCGTGQP